MTVTATDEFTDAHAGDAGQVIEIEGFVGLDVLGDDLQQKIPFAGERVALQHFGPIANRRLEFGERAAAGGREFHVRKNGDIQP